MLEKMRKFKIGVLLGGASSERAVSIRSGTAVYEALKREGLNVVKVDVKDKPQENIKKAAIDIAFIALHGKGGEDGTIQAVLDKMKIEYTGANAKASALAFDKWNTKKVLVKNKIPTPPGILITRKTMDEQLKKLSFPLFLKPIDEGSSIGVKLLNDRRTVQQEVQESLKKYDSLILEERIFGREMTVGVLGDMALPIVELVPSGPFYDYASKYTAGKTRYFADVQMDKNHYERCQSVALQVFKALKVRDFGRVDIMVDSNNTPYVLELNSIPGMTDLSLLPKAAAKVGIDFDMLCMKILSYAVERKLARRK